MRLFFVCWIVIELVRFWLMIWCFLKKIFCCMLLFIGGWLWSLMVVYCFCFSWWCRWMFFLGWGWVCCLFWWWWCFLWYVCLLVCCWVYMSWCDWFGKLNGLILVWLVVGKIIMLWFLVVLILWSFVLMEKLWWICFGYGGRWLLNWKFFFFCILVVFLGCCWKLLLINNVMLLSEMWMCLWLFIWFVLRYLKWRIFLWWVIYLVLLIYCFVFGKWKSGC